MIDIPTIIQTKEQLTAVIRITVAREEIQLVMDSAIKEICNTLAIQQISPIAGLFSYHLKRPSEIFDFEVGFPVSTAIKPCSRVTTSRLPAATVARTIYYGGYQGLAAAWGQFFEYLKDQGYAVQGSLWECYLSGPLSSLDEAEWRTELNCPLMLS